MAADRFLGEIAVNAAFSNLRTTSAT